MEYLTIDRDFKIIDKSFNVQRFADCPNEVSIGQDVRLGFPELIGLEEVLIDILEGRQVSFDLEGIFRCLNNQTHLYVDISISCLFFEGESCKNLILFFKEVTDKMILEQSLVQDSNATKLLLNSLAAAKDYIDKVITSMASVLLVTNKAGKIKTVNRAAIELFSYSEAELIGQEISTLIDDKNFLCQTSQEHSLFDKTLNDVEIVCKTKKGEKIYVAFSCSAIQTEIEELQDVIYVGRDITEHQRIQQRQAAQYATTRILSESATIKQATSLILQAICESLGWDLGEIWTTEVYLGSSNQGQGDSNPTILRCVETWVKPSVTIPEFINLTKQINFVSGEGLPGIVWATLSPQWITDLANKSKFLRSEAATKVGLHGAFGFPIMGDNEILGVMIFLTKEVQPPDENLIQTMLGVGSQMGQFIKRKQAEIALQESEEKYRDLFENASDLIQSVTPTGRFVYVNWAWRETLGYTEAEVAQLKAFDVIYPDSQQHCMEVFQRVMSGQKVGQIKAEFITKNGEKISVEGNVNCKFLDGKPIATRAIFRDITERLQTEEALRYQQQQTESLLRNILPAPIAERLKHHPSTIADNFAEVTVLFADIVGFTELSARNSPTELVEILNVIFSEFDQLAELHGLEKIKTIGDAYMVVGGLPVPQANHASAIAEMALDMQSTIARFDEQTGKALSIRIGINSGAVVAGVIGIKKFSYDLWGDTVNIASRMESHGLAGRIQVTSATYERLCNQYLFEEPRVIQVKGKGEMTTYFLIGRK